MELRDFVELGDGCYNDAWVVEHRIWNQCMKLLVRAPLEVAEMGQAVNVVVEPAPLEVQ